MLPSLFEEAFRTLRASLLLRLSDGPKVLVVTGARPQEGKSTVAANLASSLSSGESVALIDADFRRPRQHELFDLPNEQGFADVLAGTARLESCFRRVSGSLSVVTSGSRPRDPLELLARDQFDAALKSLRTEFSLVVIDSAPVLAVADAMSIGPRVNGVLMVLRWGVVTMADARLARHRLESTGSTLLGCVLSQAPRAGYSNYHPYDREYANVAAPTRNAPLGLSVRSPATGR